MKWGLLGGTFNPIHIGHLRCAEEILEMFGLDRVLFVPALQPPHKNQVEITSFRHREHMVTLAIEDHPSFLFCDAEKQRKEKSYSVETVEDMLKINAGNLELYFILGQDAFQDILTWKDWETLLLLCHFVIMTRSGFENKGLEAVLPASFASRFVYDDHVKGFRGPTGFDIFFREVTRMGISSSDIRNRVKEGKSIKFLVPESVRCYIEKNNLYQDL
jgi:nicotinate-nucleotide adenylyltransferase